MTLELYLADAEGDDPDEIVKEVTPPVELEDENDDCDDDEDDDKDDSDNLE